MKKTFPLHLAGKDDQRVLEAVKNDVRKYVKRERRKALPEGVDFWDFDCKVGASNADAGVKHWEEVTGAIDAVVAAGDTEVYVEILAKPGRRTPKPVDPAVVGTGPDASASHATDLAEDAPEPAGL